MRHPPSSHTLAMQVRKELESERIQVGGPYREQGRKGRGIG